MKQEIIYGDTVNYWKTSTKASESWLASTKKLIQDIEGKVHTEMIATVSGKTAIMLGFAIGDDNYKIVYPILAIRKEADRQAATIQAATALYHEVKALIVSAKFRGIRGAFTAYLVLPDGRTAGDLSAPEIANAMPAPFLISAPKGS